MNVVPPATNMIIEITATAKAIKHNVINNIIIKSTPFFIICIVVFAKIKETQYESLLFLNLRYKPQLNTVIVTTNKHIIKLFVPFLTTSFIV